MLLLVRGFLGVHLLVFLAYGVAFLGWPHLFAAKLGIALQSTAAVADFRAMYGGLCLGISVLFLLGMLSVRWQRAALLIAVLTAAGLLAGRLWTLLVDADVGVLMYGFMAVEIVAIASGTFFLRQVTP